MSAPKSNMPRGTRQAALIAFALAACLLAWRGMTLLSSETPADAAAKGDPALHALLDPVLGKNSFRLASHTGDDGARSVLILVDAPEARFHLDTETSDRIETILSAATGFDSSRDSLQIQPFAFAPGTTGGLAQADMLELGAMVLLTGLLGFLAFAPAAAQPLPAQSGTPDPFPLPKAPVAPTHLRAVPDEASVPASQADAQRLASENPKQTAQIIRSWMNDGGSS